VIGRLIPLRSNKRNVLESDEARAKWRLELRSNDQQPVSDRDRKIM